MIRRSGRGQVDRDTVLANLREGREGALLVCMKAKTGSAEYAAAGRVIEAIDGLAEVLTGNRELFWLPLRYSRDDSDGTSE